MNTTAIFQSHAQLNQHKSNATTSTSPIIKHPRHHLNTTATTPLTHASHPTGYTEEFRDYLAAALIIAIAHAVIHALSSCFNAPNVRRVNTSVFLMISASFYSILATAAKQSHEHLLFDTKSSVFYTEAMKLVFMIVLNLKRCCAYYDGVDGVDELYASDASHEAHRGFLAECRSLRGRDVATLAVPAVLFAVQNNLNYVAFEYVDAETFQMLGTLKILFTGLTSSLVLRKQLSAQQYYALASVSIGVVISNMCRTEEGNTFVWGAIIVCFNQLLAAFALVVNEYILTDWNCVVSFYTKNTLMYVFGTLINMPLWTPGSLTRFNFVAWALTIHLAIIGVSVAFVISDIGAIVRNLLGAGSLVCTSAIVHVKKWQLPDKPSVMSTLLIVLSILQYFHSPPTPSRPALVK